MRKNTLRIQDELTETLRTVACCDLRVSVSDLGLVDSVSVSEEGVAHVEVLPCCTYGMARLEHEIARETRSVDGVSDVRVDIAWDDCWDPERMSETVDEVTPDIEELAATHGIEPRWELYHDDG